MKGCVEEQVVTLLNTNRSPSAGQSGTCCTSGPGWSLSTVAVLLDLVADLVSHKGHVSFELLQL